MFHPSKPINPFTVKLTSTEVLSLIAEFLPKQHIHFTEHVQQRITQQDRNFSIQRLLFILQHPKSVAEGEWNNKYNTWGYEVTGYNNRHVVVSFKTDKDYNTYIELVTVY